MGQEIIGFPVTTPLEKHHVVTIKTRVLPHTRHDTDRSSFTPYVCVLSTQLCAVQHFIWYPKSSARPKLGFCGVWIAYVYCVCNYFHQIQLSAYHRNRLHRVQEFNAVCAYDGGVLHHNGPLHGTNYQCNRSNSICMLSKPQNRSR